MRFLETKTLLFFIILLTFTGCSNSANPTMTPVQPEQLSNENPSCENPDISINEPEIYLTYARDGSVTYQAPLAVAHVTIDPEKLEAEINPSRNAQAIGDVFDADLTQFLRFSPCVNCLELGEMNISSNGNVVVEFKIRHPFTNLSARPDLHVFDVRGITITGGNKVFAQTKVMNPGGVNEDAQGNVGLLVNADGYTSHFDSLAENPIYFYPPRTYEGNINPFKKFFIDSTGGTFDPFNPKGYNVMKVGAGWSSAYYEFKPPTSGNIDFVLVIDCAYGHSAVFKNRLSPKYYIPWFNRKEPWKLVAEILSNDLNAQDTQSSATIRAQVCDWQAGIQPDSQYPDSGLNTIPVKSDVKRVTIEIPGITGTLKIKTIADGGNGSNNSPYRYDFIIKNELAALGGTYYGLVAARDDIDGTAGPLPVKPGPSGLPFEGPDLKDYSIYQAFQIEVAGAPNSNPVIDVRPYALQNPVYELTPVKFIVEAHDPDDDQLTYYWDQIDIPQGYFQTRDESQTYWVSPNVTQNKDYTITVTINDGRGGSVNDSFVIQVNKVNIAPYITDGPTFFPIVIDEQQYITIQMEVIDLDGDPLTYQWLQLEPVSPRGQFDYPNTREPRWLAPAVPVDTIFKLKVIVSDLEQSVTGQISVPVGAINEAPVGSLWVDVDPPVFNPSQTIYFKSSFDDPDGNSIATHEWDFDYDGITFDVDYNSGPSGNVNLGIPDVGTRLVAVRGTDDGNPPLNGIATLEIAVKGLWGVNYSAGDMIPPTVKIGSASNQKCLARNGDKVHLVYEAKYGGNKYIRVASSNDGGNSFGSSVTVTSAADTATLESPSILCHGDDVWVAWKHDNDVKFARSTNGGSSFGSSLSLSPSSINGDHKPSLAYDPTDDELFVVFADRDTSANGILSLRKSTDGGGIFNSMTSVITDNTAPVSETAIASVAGGNLYVAWIDSRNNPAGDLFFAKSSNGGQSFSINRQVNQDFSGAGIQNPSISTGPDGEAYFTWRDYRSGKWMIYFGKTTGSGVGVVNNTNTTPLITYDPLNPQIYVNEHGRITIVFSVNDGSSNYVMATSSASGGQEFEPTPAIISDTLTSSSSLINCDIAGTILSGPQADSMLIVWTDFRNGESVGYGDIFMQIYLREAY